MYFNSMWECKNVNKPLNVPKIEKYIYDSIVYRPCAKDEKGKVINDTRFDMVVRGQKTKLQDYVQSFADETDVYKILERCARSGDYSVLAGDSAYGDCTPYSADRAVNDVTLKKLQEQNGKAPSEVAEAILSNLSDDDIMAIFDKLNNKNKTVENKIVENKTVENKIVENKTVESEVQE